MPTNPVMITPANSLAARFDLLCISDLFRIIAFQLPASCAAGKSKGQPVGGFRDVQAATVPASSLQQSAAENTGGGALAQVRSNKVFQVGGKGTRGEKGTSDVGILQL